MYYLYILKSQNNKFYIGVTSNLDKRLLQHNCGQSKSTKAFRPWKIVYKEKYLNKTSAYKREFYLKSPKGFLEKKMLFSKL